jgi:hypothetical protein
MVWLFGKGQGGVKAPEASSGDHNRIYSNSLLGWAGTGVLAPRLLHHQEPTWGRRDGMMMAWQYQP